MNENVKAALILFDLKEGATITDIRAEYLDKTANYKFQRVLSPEEEDLQEEFLEIYRAYIRLIKSYSEKDSAQALGLYPPDQVFQFHFNQGVYYFITQQYLKAGEKFQEAYNIDNKKPLVLIYLGVLLLKRKNFYAAEKYFKDAALLDKENDDAWFYLGESYLKAGQYRKAVTMFETSKTLNPQREQLTSKIREAAEKGGIKVGTRSRQRGQGTQGNQHPSFLKRIIDKLFGK